jgi:predicted nucleic acid-binding protein
MAQRFLIDTSAVIKYLNGVLHEEGLLFMEGVVAGERIISFVSEIELQSWIPHNQSDLEIYQFFVSQSIIIGVDGNIIKETIKIRKNFKLKLPDALIAATAIVNDLTLIADNDKDFLRVKKLKYFNPRVAI